MTCEKKSELQKKVLDQTGRLRGWDCSFSSFPLFTPYGANNMSLNQFCGRTRREFLWETGGGFTGLALAGLLGNDFFARQSVAADGQTPFVNPLAPKKPHFAGKA